MAKEKKINTKEVIIVTITLTLICLITTALLAIINHVTVEPIAQNLAKAENEARKSVVASASDFVERQDGAYYEGVDANGNVVGYAVSTCAKGYGGDVVVMTGFDVDGTITKVVIVAADDETPGLGAKIKDDAFLSMFAGKSGELKLVTASQKTGADNEIDALTSATYSSVAVVNAVNEASAIVSAQLDGGDGQ
ncbi:MAG: RnfABCDGE type electron transport complex subunit G [Clostridia bacterium]|nr:RnfABCDGE type electron transport complex subunit G [Clostridia bacterium]